MKERGVVLLIKALQSPPHLPNTSFSAWTFNTPAPLHHLKSHTEIIGEKMMAYFSELALKLLNPHANISGKKTVIQLNLLRGKRSRARKVYRSISYWSKMCW